MNSSMLTPAHDLASSGEMVILVNPDQHSYLIRPLILEISGHRSYSIQTSIPILSGQKPAPHFM
jgi:hypothetical protein